MIDMHCHILSGMDDGAATMEKAIQMADLARQDGIQTIIATPHFVAGHFENDLDLVEKAVEQLNAQLDESLSPKIIAGQEIMLDRYVLQYLKHGLIRGINGSRYLLLELPMTSCPEYTVDILYELRIEGFVPIIAHPERYEYIIKDMEKAREFLREGCLFQINADSINGNFGRRIKKTAIELVKHGMTSFVASDAHGTRARRPELSSAYAQLEKIDRTLPQRLQENASKLVSNQKISVDYETQSHKTNIFDLYRKISVREEGKKT